MHTWCKYPCTAVKLCSLGSGKQTFHPFKKKPGRQQYSASLWFNANPFGLTQEVTRLSDLAEILHVPISAPTVRFPKIFEALPGFFLTRCPKKSLVEHQKFVTSRGTCRYLHLQNFSQIGPLVLKLFIANYWATLQGIGQHNREGMYPHIYTILSQGSTVEYLDSFWTDG